MSISSIVAFADLSFLTAFLFWIAADQTQVPIEPLDLPEAHIAVISHEDLGPDVQILNIRWFDKGRIPQIVKEQYAEAGMGGMISDHDSFTDVIWNGEILYPAIPPGGFGSCVKGRPDLYWKLSEAAKQWPKDAPVIIRAGRFTPMRRISKADDVFNRYGLQDHDVQLAVIDCRE